MAQHLEGSGYKDAAAVIAGSALEAHLRALCVKHSVPTEESRPDGSLSRKKADRLNADLAKTNAYSLLDQKNVTAWLDLRNKAAHGHYGEYSREQVALVITAIRDFVSRVPG